MAVHLRILLILIRLAGIHSITTVSQVSVRDGGSVSIPCLYGLQYTNYVKYLCQGYTWDFCSTVVKTNKQSSGKYSISDDKIQRIFTVTIKDLRYADSGYYWCAVEINGGSDVRVYFHLSVTTGIPGISVDHQQIRAFRGDSTTIKCNHWNSGEMKWCRLGSSCVTGSSGSIDGTKVTINTRALPVFTVTMSELRTESSGWYWCANRDFQMPVHLTVSEKPTATTHATTTRLTTISPTPQPVTLIPSCAPTTVQVEQQSSSIDPKILFIPLILLILIVMVALLLWFLLKMHKQSKEVSSAEAEEGITYCNVGYMRKTPSQKPGRGHAHYVDIKNLSETPDTEMDADVMYSSVVAKRPKASRKTPDTQRDVDVVYSSVVPMRPKTARTTPGTESEVDVMYSSVVPKRPKTAREQVEANDKNVTYSSVAFH